MKSGITLNFGDDNTASIKQVEVHLPCFGGVTCSLASRQPESVFLSDGSELEYEAWVCDHTGELVARLKKCPLKRWVTLATLHEPLDLNRKVALKVGIL